ncbi:MAG: sensor protein KdpD [Parabacteroides sp.]|jgi:two-component system sensor histidine kinase KdpD|nr:sensor protein KdpD [Parabacteroides sp.]
MERVDDARYFLDLIQRAKHGKFKIYIGMIAGVGKTYRMLLDARELLKNGINVQIGYIETHGRADTAKLLEGLPIIPCKKVFYKGKELEEMDMETILQLHPELVIVDELAHTNVEGSKNEKRWQDVMELLDAGINILSAVNIQHIESLNEDVKHIVNIEVKERIPDSVLQEADEVVNIDLTADELIERLRNGKIYEPDKIEMALNHFFTSEHILQLRELALKEVALRVSKKVENEVGRNISTVQKHFMACINTDEKKSRYLIHKVARFASGTNAKFSVLHVRTPQEQRDKISLAAQRHLINNFMLAVDLGAEVVQYDAPDIIAGIVDVCKTHHISSICVGKPKLKLISIIFATFRYRYLVNELSKLNIDLIILS